MELYHYGMPRRSGRYPFGSGDRPYQHRGAVYRRTEKETLTGPTKIKYSEYNKRHYDTTIKEGSELATLSYNPNRTKDTDMFYAAHTKKDMHKYMAKFNPVKLTADGLCLKKRISNIASKDIKVASEDSAAETFRKLYENDGDFYKFVTDKNRMQNLFVNHRYVFKGYREARDVLEKLRKGVTATDKDLQVAYRMFNYVIPNEDRDAVRQRGKFFNSLRQQGYSAVLDTNDAIYDSYHAESPVIVFDQEHIALGDIRDTKVSDVVKSKIASIGMKFINEKGEYDDLHKN